MLTHKKRAKRRHLKLGGVIVNIDGSIIGQCRTGNVSATGAKIVVPESMTVPDEFILLFSSKGQVRRRCKVAWRSKAEIGVQFIFHAEDVASAVGTSGH